MHKISSLLLLLISFSAFSQEKWDLRKCVDYAMANNITVKQAEAQAALSRLTADQVKKTLYPTVGGSMSGTYQRGLNENPTTGTLESANYLTGSIGVQSGYTIFNWGTRKNNIAANELFAKADEVGIAKAKNDIALLVANAFLQVMLRKEQVRISEVQLNQSKAQLANTRKLVDAGSQPELNAIQVEAQLARDTSAYLEAQSLVEQGLVTIKAYLNLDQAKPFDIESPAVDNIPVDNIADLQPEAVYNLALNTQPEQQQTKLRIEASEKQVAAARGAMYPTLSAFAGLNTRVINGKFPYLVGVTPNQPTGAYILDPTGNKVDVLSSRQVFGERAVGLFTQLNNNFGQSLGLQINFPIFNQGTLRTQWERSKVFVRQSQLQDEQEKITLKADIYNAYQTAFASLQKYNAAVRNVAASQKAVDFSKKRFDIGLLGTLDYLITQSNLFTAKIEEASNHYDYIFKMKVLEFYKGEGLKL